VEPGTFDPKTIKDRYYPGFLLFMLASPTKDSIAIFEQMLTASRQIAHALNGQLCDSEGHSLTLKTIETLRQQIDQLSVHPAYPSAEITTY
jgi:FtsZ-interacting cell division protein ZipA